MAKKIIPMQKEIILNGYIEEIEWGHGRSGIIIDDGNDEYIVVMNKIGKKMLDYVDEEVEASGIVTRKDGDLMFTASHFEPVDYFCDDDYDFGEFDDYGSA